MTAVTEVYAAVLSCATIRLTGVPFHATLKFMETVLDFILWAGGPTKAAAMVGRSKASMSRLANGKQRLTAQLAEKIEEASNGIFRKERLMWPASSGGRRDA